MAKKHYYVPENNEIGFEELTESEFYAIIGDETTHPYVYKVYSGELSIDEVPEDIREAVQTIVNNNISRWGLWKDLPASAQEISYFIEVLSNSNLTKGQVADLFADLEKLRNNATDNQALESKHLYPLWSSGSNYTAGLRLLYNDTLYRVLQDHTSQDNWTPDITPTLFVVIEVTHSGTENDPIPYNGNMELVNGLYYIENETIYLCTRNSEQPVYNALADLVGLYVEVI